ncbi:hypothetical protein [Isoptericola variabilis]|uniref:Uncharacterized protein n=1 Tax=Isoptericola variabilis (strain 225) TaxID=743718 RepID=F6FRZ6_ISOV2|nr:hypothetical protein [Isoptericola variabilis]AEG43997.1 hypothetical protein Isova_1228 [Isoptericola variabilis 225]TWH30591.1 hypothetical protein L600_000300001440 [Isoptericola variabilis J7]
MAVGTGLVTDYFAAPTDALAAAVLREHAGPSTPARGSGEPLFDTVSLPAVEPFVMLGMLAHLLSGRPYREVTAHPRHASLVAVGGDEGPWVVTVSDRLVADLAACPPTALTDVAVRWSGTPELAAVPPDAVLPAVHALAGLAARAIEARHGLYCWTRLDPA